VQPYFQVLQRHAVLLLDFKALLDEILGWG
jgi:hypothetical protein